MYPIVEKKLLGEDVALLKVQAPHIAKAQAGQFVMLQTFPESEIIPISILETYQEGFTCLVQAVGRSTLEIIQDAQSFIYVGGPMGKPFPVESYGRVLAYAYGWGLSPVINVAKHLRQQGNTVDLVVVGKPIDGLIDTYREVFGNLYFEESFSSPKEGYDIVYSAGSNSLSKELSQAYPKVISMVNVYMLDSIGLCLVCRVFVNQEQKLACVDGPWFDAKAVDWDNLIGRENLYQEQEKQALVFYIKERTRRKAKEVSQDV